MPFSDQDEPSTPKRRRGKRGSAEGSYDDFWGRESVGPRGRARRKGEGEDRPEDLSDLSDPAPRRGPAGPRGVNSRTAGAPPLPQRGDATGGGRRPPGAAAGAAAGLGPPSGAPSPLRRPGGPDPAARGRSAPGGRAPRRQAAPDYGDRTPAPGGPGRGPAAGGYDERWTGRAPATAPGGYDIPGIHPEPEVRYQDTAGPYWAARGPGLARGPGAADGTPPGGSPDAPWAQSAEGLPLAGGPHTGTYGADYAGAPARGRGVAGTDPTTGDSYGDDAYYDEHDGDYDEDEKPRRRGCAVALAVLAVLVIAAAVAGWFGWSWVQGEIDPPGGPGEEVLVEVPEGTSTSGIGKAMAEAGVITNASVWDWYTKLRDVGSFQAGTYRMRLNSSFDEAVADLEKDPLPPNSQLVTVPPGLTVNQVIEYLVDPAEGVPGFTREGLQAALDDPTLRSTVLPPEQASLEGTLFPETHSLEEGDTELIFLKRVVGELDATLAELDITNRAAQVGLTPYEVMVVASLVEEEAAVDEDRAKVARVIYNRLAAGEALFIDATSCYESGVNPCDPSLIDWAADTPYNTRTRAGLPPTPIASPGRASIEAALAPADGPWKWYVLADADGHHAFTDDYDEFLRLKAECADKGLGCG
jgi:UPF0755 protein